MMQILGRLRSSAEFDPRCFPEYDSIMFSLSKSAGTVTRADLMMEFPEYTTDFLYLFDEEEVPFGQLYGAMMLCLYL